MSSPNTAASRVSFQRIRSEAAATLRLAAPLIAAQLAQISMSFVDTVMAGNLSSTALAGVAVGGGVWFSFLFICTGLMLAVSPSVSQLYGAGRFREVGSCVRQGLWLSLGTALLTIGAVHVIAPWVRILNVPPEVASIATRWLMAISWGLPGFCAYQALRSYSEGVSMTKPILYVSLLALGTNITGNWVFMYGNLGAPALGAVGTAVASAISMWVMLIVMALYIYRKPAYRQFDVFDRFEKPSWPQIRALVRLGTPIAVSLCMEGSLFGVVSVLMGTLGTTAVAGHQIALNVASITFMVPMGLAMAISVRVGQAIGRGEPGGARIAGFVGIVMAASFMAFSAVVMAAANDWIAGIYTRDPDVREMAASLLLLAAVFQISDGLQVSGSGALRGLKDTKTPMIITVVAYWIIAFPLCYLLGFVRGGGPQAAWVGLVLGLTIAAVLLNARFYAATRGE